VFAFAFGSVGDYGRSFLEDLKQANLSNIGSALLGGVVFNAANILLVAAIALSGMSVAFPVGIGLALVLGVLINYVFDLDPTHRADPLLLFTGVALVTAAIILDALAYKKLSGPGKTGSTKGLVLALLCGILMSIFYFLVARAIGMVEVHPFKSREIILAAVNADNLRHGVIQAGKMTAYTANVVFALGILLSNFVFNTAIMLKPFVGEPVPLGDYFKGAAKDHLWGLFGGVIWGVGMTLNIAASGRASAAVAYGLGQGATLVAALWGVFVWREFRTAPRGTKPLLTLMFLCFIVGLGLVIASKMDLIHHAAGALPK
jgi:glucose uptake protein